MVTSRLTHLRQPILAQNLCTLIKNETSDYCIFCSETYMDDLIFSTCVLFPLADLRIGVWGGGGPKSFISMQFSGIIGQSNRSDFSIILQIYNNRLSFMSIDRRPNPRSESSWSCRVFWACCRHQFTLLGKIWTTYCFWLSPKTNGCHCKDLQ